MTSVLVLSATPLVHVQRTNFPALQPSEAQRNAGPRHRYDPQALDIWLKAVEAHRPGIIDEPARTIAAFDDRKLWGVIADLTELFKLQRDMRVRTPDPNRPSAGKYGGVTLTLAQLDSMFGIDVAHDPDNRVNRILKRGTILHTDIAFLAPRRLLRATGADDRDNPSTVILGQDGRFDSTTDILVHIVIGRYLLDGVTPDPARDDGVRAWYYATLSIFEEHHMFGDVRRHVERALELMADDPIILFYAGAFREMLAGSSVQGVATEATSMGFNVSVLSTKAELQAARMFYSTALTMGSVDPELYLHLGRVSGLLGDHEAAIASLTRASDGLREPALQYDAALFLAAEYEALERWDDTRASVMRASDLFPKAQSALVALSRLRHRQGDAPGTIAPLEQMFGLRGSDLRRDDPWWHYPESHARNSTALLVRARQRLAGDKP